MVIEAGVVVGYLTAALGRGARQLGDRAFEAILDRLAGLIERRIGGSALDEIANAPGQPDVEARVSRNIQTAANVDPHFAREIADLVSQLDQRGGRDFINQVYAQTNVQSFGPGMAAGRDLMYFNAPDPTDLSSAPGWAKACIVLGAVLAVVGMFIFGYTLFTDNQDLGSPDFGKTPTGIPIAFGVFFAGFVVLGIGAFGRSMSKRR